jgi:hypothetical protein
LADRDGQVKALTNDLSITVAKALKDNSDKDAAISTLTADLKFTSETLSSLKLRSSGFVSIYSYIDTNRRGSG